MNARLRPWLVRLLPVLVIAGMVAALALGAQGQGEDRPRVDVVGAGRTPPPAATPSPSSYRIPGAGSTDGSVVIAAEERQV